MSNLTSVIRVQIDRIAELESQVEALEKAHKALGTILERFEPCLKDYIFSKRYALIDARTAYDAAIAEGVKA